MFKEIYKRKYYLNKISGFIHDADIIKVITGIRRCGKSSFLKSIVNELENNGVKQKDIIYINLDEKCYLNIKNSNQLEKEIDDKTLDSDFKYLFIDEIQNVNDFEPLINAYRETKNFSIKKKKYL